MATETPAASSGQPKWPSKTREIQNHTFDSTVWEKFHFRDDDIIVATWAKSGTTWMQQIVLQLLTLGSEEGNLHETSPWLDLRLVPQEPTLAALEAQDHRRCVKTHLPVDALVYSPNAKYIFVGRDGRDALWSMHNHYHRANDMFYQMFNETPGRVGPALERPPADPVEYFRDLLRDDHDLTKTHSPFFEHIRSWWEIRQLPNILFVHFSDLKADRKGELERISKFLGVDVPEEKWGAIIEHTSFEWMKQNSNRMSPPGTEVVFEGGSKSFINKGTNGRWVDELSTEDVSRYEEKARGELGADCAEWLAKGSSALGVQKTTVS